MTQAYPLQWPAGWPRTPLDCRESSRGKFRRPGRPIGSYTPRNKDWTFAEARDALYDEVRRLGGHSPVLSTNFSTDRYGDPTDRGKARPIDQGAAIYFTLGNKPTVMACDMHVRAEENMRSLTLSIEAMRALERHGGGKMMERAFEGFAALPAPGAKPWWQILGVSADARQADIEAAYRRLARERHPDTGGSEAMMADLNVARDAGLKSNGGQPWRVKA